MTNIEKIVTAAAITILGSFVYALFVIVPVMAYTEAECLRKGYPKSHVTVGLERYCSNFDGAMTVRVTRQ